MQWDRFVQDPAWLPHVFDAQRDALIFAYTPAGVRDIVFLDPRFMRNVPLSPPAPIAELAAAEPHSAPLHFVFHTALCCSTLLVRALAAPGLAASLREPLVLISLDDAAGRKAGAATQRAVKVALDLLARPLNAGECRLSNPATRRTSFRLTCWRFGRTRSFCCCIRIWRPSLSRPSARIRPSARASLPAFRCARLRSARFLMEAPQTHLHAAAYAWLKQMALFGELVRMHGPRRVRALNSATFLTHKAETLMRAGAWFGIDQSAKAWAGIADGPVFKRHAKSPPRAFTEEARRADHAHRRATHAREIDAALSWAGALAASQGLPLTLDDTLFDDPL